MAKEESVQGTYKTTAVHLNIIKLFLSLLHTHTHTFSQLKETFFTYCRSHWLNSENKYPPINSAGKIYLGTHNYICGRVLDNPDIERLKVRE